MTDAAAETKAIIDRSSYMTLATADRNGSPWATPVWYAPQSHTSMLWISPPEARHSRNLEQRADLGIVIFDSSAPFGTGDAVFFEATAERVTDAELDDAIAVFSLSTARRGGDSFDAGAVRAPAPFRLYRATVTAAFLGGHEGRQPVDLNELRDRA